MSVQSPYPDAIATDVNLPDVVQFVDTYDAEDMNNVRAYIRDMTSVLGSNPQGTKSTLVDRLAVSLNPDGSFIWPNNMVTVGQNNAQFTTIQAAIDSITDATGLNPYVVLVFPGVYEENITIKAMVHIIALSPQATFIYGKVTSALGSDWVYMNINIKNEDAPCIHITDPDTRLTYTGVLSPSGDYAVHNNQGRITLYGEIVSSSGAKSLVYNQAGSLRCFAHLKTLSGTHPAVQVVAGEVDIYSNILSETMPAIQHDGGKCRIFNSHIELYDNFDTGSPIVLNGSGLVLYNAVIRSNHTSAKSVYASSAQSFKAFGSYTNVSMHANVTNLISGGLVVDSNVE